MEVHYHPGKANVVADALSRESHLTEEESLSLNDFEVLAHIALVSDLLEQIIQGQKKDEIEIPHIKKLIDEGCGPHVSIDGHGVVKFKNHLVVPKYDELIGKILEEAHNSKPYIHPGSNKMYHDLRQSYWWPNMKRDVTRHVTECDTCGRVKAYHLHTPGFLHPLPILVWKWEDISMDFIVGCTVLPRGITPFG
jgi:hypothetical protein